MSEDVRKTLGDYPELRKITHEENKGSKLVELDGVGHAPHIEAFNRFIQPLLVVFEIVNGERKIVDNSPLTCSLKFRTLEVSDTTGDEHSDTARNKKTIFHQYMSIKEEWIRFILDLQSDICGALESCDGKAKFIEDEWQRARRWRRQNKSDCKWKCI